MKIEGTELECNEADCVALDYFLGGNGENKDAWAKRVWDMCAEYKATNGLGRNGKGMPTVYAEDPVFLWEQKKRRRRIALVSELTQKKHDKHLAETKKIKDDLKNNRSPEWSFEFADAQVLELKNHQNYKTREQKEKENQEEVESSRLAILQAINEKVSLLRAKGFDDETIKVIFPKASKVI